MTQQPKNAGDEVAIAAAGPAVSFAIAGIGLVGTGLIGGAFFELLTWINVIIGGFNLIPALPMDGGRILRALLSRRVGFRKATYTAVKLSRYVAVAFALYGIVSLHLYFVLLAGVLWFMSMAELAVSSRVGYRDQSAQWRPEVEVMPRGFEPRRASAGAAESWGRSFRTRGGFTLRRVDGRWVVDVAP